MPLPTCVPPHDVKNVVILLCRTFERLHSTGSATTVPWLQHTTPHLTVQHSTPSF